jgi:hypothetical protein
VKRTESVSPPDPVRVAVPWTWKAHGELGSTSVSVSLAAIVAVPSPLALPVPWSLMQNVLAPQTVNIPWPVKTARKSSAPRAA